MGSSNIGNMGTGTINTGTINQVTLMGRVGREPRWAKLAGGGVVCNVALATHDAEEDWRTGEVREATHWHRVVLGGSVALALHADTATAITKGDALYVEGRMRTRKWTDRLGMVRYVTEIIATRVQLYRKATAADEDGGGRLDDPGISAWLADYDAASARLRAAMENQQAGVGRRHHIAAQAAMA